ncbi:MAG: DUF6265 family protein [Bacteroidota bacterium]
MKKYFFLFLCGLLACQPSYETNDFDMEWLSHIWEQHSENGKTGEAWAQINSTEWKGIGYMVAEGDTLFVENLRIRKKDDVMKLYASVPSQNDGKTIVFSEAKRQPDTLSFVNPSHDFPQKITYIRLSDTELKTVVEGPVDGEWKTNTARFTRQ